MAKKKLFGNNIKPSCKYCELGIAGVSAALSQESRGTLRIYV